MATSIKITALTDIGANLAYSTIVPVVDMAGTPTTEKATLQLIGNLILTGSGGPNFVTATRSLTAATVTTAAQANITSVGTLTSLAVSGTTTSGNITSPGNITAATFNGTLIGGATTASSVTANAQANITSVGTLSSLAVTANVTANNCVATFFVKSGAETVETIIAAATAGVGARSMVTNSDTVAFANFGNVVANSGAGANTVPVYSDGTNWRIG